MQILYVAFNFTLGMGYQDNFLIIEHIKDGHDVTLISNTREFKEGKLVYSAPCDSIVYDHFRLIRLPYRFLGLAKLTTRIRDFLGFYDKLIDISPDLIFIQDIAGKYVIDIIKYKKAFPKCRLVACTHAAAYNSGQNIISLYLLNGYYYRKLTQKILPFLDKYFYIGKNEEEFAKKIYGVPEKSMEFFPLGGIVLEEKEYLSLRQKYREQLGIESDCLVFFHSGKLAREKWTIPLLKAFSKSYVNARMVVAGSVGDEIEDDFIKLLEKDNRIKYIGWQSAKDLNGFLCACDLYCQPASVSATVQQAICCRCPVLAQPIEGFKFLKCGGFIWVTSEEEIIRAFNLISDGQYDLEALAMISGEYARKELDYKKLARRLTSLVIGTEG